MKTINEQTFLEISATKSIPFSTITEIGIRKSVDQIHEVFARCGATSHTLFSSKDEEEVLEVYKAIHVAYGDVISIKEIIEKMQEEENTEENTEENILEDTLIEEVDANQKEEAIVSTDDVKLEEIKPKTRKKKVEVEKEEEPKGFKIVTKGE